MADSNVMPSATRKSKLIVVNRHEWCKHAEISKWTLLNGPRAPSAGTNNSNNIPNLTHYREMIIYIGLLMLCGAFIEMETHINKHGRRGEEEGRGGEVIIWAVEVSDVSSFIHYSLTIGAWVKERTSGMDSIIPGINEPDWTGLNRIEPDWTGLNRTTMPGG